jgi:hypothetical protein
MPIHDWTRVRANRFHDFHQGWIIAIRNALNRGLLPAGYFALAEQVTGGPEPDVVTLSVPSRPLAAPGGVDLAASPVRTRHQAQVELDRYAQKADRVAIHHPDGPIVAVIEIVSPGNKSSAHAISQFANKAARFLRSGIHLLIVDLFPPTKRDPGGLHARIWARITDEPFALPPDKPLTLASYASGPLLRAFVEPVAVGDVLPDMPIFLDPDHYVPCPLEATYLASWEDFPQALKGPLEVPAERGGS